MDYSAPSVKEIRDQFDYDVAYWRPIREEARIDMKHVSGDPWPDDERQARKAADRLCLTFDEISQYLNQRINDVRQNKRAIQLTPQGDGANDQTAELRAGIIRQIEYKSNAQTAYCTAFQGAIERSYGYARVSRRYVSPDSFDQELVIRSVPNPDVVYLDPEAKEADYSDMMHAFLLDTFRQKAFQERWPEAEIHDFSTELQQTAPMWIRDDLIQVAEFWKVHLIKRTLLMLDAGGGTKIHLDELPDGTKIQKARRNSQQPDLCVVPDGSAYPIQQMRKVEDKAVCQYITNGIEILEENEWPGKYIPIVPCFGKESYVDEGTGSRRHLTSLVRAARNPYLHYCYIRTCQAELIGMTPKVPRVGYEGQFDTNTPWEDINSVPLAYAEVKAVTEATGNQILPIPRLEQWQPPIQELEMAAESAKRAIESAMGMGASSVGRRDTRVQSGIALDKLDQQQDQGNYHFIDNFDRFLQQIGRVCDDALDEVYQGVRDVGIRKPDDKAEVVHIGEPFTDPKTGQTIHHRLDRGDHDVTISTGPSYDSQRREASEFADSLTKLPNLPPQIMALVVKLKNLGPIGDEIAKAFDPSSGNQDPIPPAVQQHIQQLTQMVQQLQQEIASNGPELQVKKYIAEIQEETKRVIGLAQLDQQAAMTKLEQELHIVHSKVDKAHELALQANDQQHQVDLAQQQQAAAAQQQQPEPAAA